MANHTTKTLYACLELASINKRYIANLPSQWIANDKFLLNFGEAWYQARIVKVNRKSVKHVYRMAVEGDCLKRQDVFYSCEVKERNWQVKALIAAGHSKEEITAVICAARLRGEI